LRYRTVREFVDTVLEGLSVAYSIVPDAALYSALTLNAEINELFEHKPEEIVETVGEMVMGFREKQRVQWLVYSYVAQVLAHDSLHELVHMERQNIEGKEVDKNASLQ
jgi:hypothetical protein